MMRLLAFSIVSIFFVAAFGDRAFSKEAEQFMAHDAWAPPSLDGASVGTAFTTLHNPTDTPIEIKGLSSDIATTVELHNHVMEDGHMMMRRVDPVVIRAKGEMVMKPGSYHLMLIGLKRPLVDGETIYVTISPKEGAPQRIAFPVSQARLLEALKSRSTSRHH
ncbi:MAG: copper chaperone PCu(A)C [Rickettsiales bacterium]